MRRPKILFVHGSVVNGELTWSAQKPLADRFELVIPNRRGFPPGPDVDRVDYEDEADWLEQFVAPGTHLVGHSYGGVISLFAGVRYANRLKSLTLVEPPAFRIAAGDPVVDDYIAASERIWTERSDDPSEFLRSFLHGVGSSIPPATNASAAGSPAATPNAGGSITVSDRTLSTHRAAVKSEMTPP